MAETEKTGLPAICTDFILEASYDKLSKELMVLCLSLKTTLKWSQTSL